MPLDPDPARPLTDRECAKIFSGVLGTLLAMAEPADVKTALQWTLAHFDDCLRANEVAMRAFQAHRGRN
jgi:hypothetical protein